MTSSVSSANTDYSSKYLSTGISTLSKSGLISSSDASNMSAILKGDDSTLVNNLLANTGMSEELQTLIYGVYDIVKAVMVSGSQAAQPDVDAASTDKTAMEDVVAKGTAAGSDAQKEGEEIQSDTLNQGSTLNAKVNAAGDQIKNTEEEAQEEIDTLTEENEQKQEEIKANQKIIEERTAEQTELLSKINAKKEELGISTAQPQNSSPPDGASEDKDQTSASTSGTFISTDGCEDPELNDLVAQYNANCVEITGLDMINQALSTDITTNTETIKETQDTAIQVTAEQSAQIDEAVTQIVSLSTSAKGALNEVQNLLKGQLNQFDNLMLIKLSVAMTKSAVCGTKSGLLAAAASAMGVGCIVSFGATAQKAADLTQASLMEGNASFKQIANNVAGKMLEAQMNAYMSQVWSNIGNSIGVDISSYMNDIFASAQETKSLAQSSKFYQAPDADETGNEEIKKDEEQAPQTA